MKEKNEINKNLFTFLCLCKVYVAKQTHLSMCLLKNLNVYTIFGILYCS